MAFAFLVAIAALLRRPPSSPAGCSGSDPGFHREHTSRKFGLVDPSFRVSGFAGFGFLPKEVFEVVRDQDRGDGGGDGAPPLQGPPTQTRKTRKPGSTPFRCRIRRRCWLPRNPEPERLNPRDVVVVVVAVVVVGRVDDDEATRNPSGVTQGGSRSRGGLLRAPLGSNLT